MIKVWTFTLSEHDYDKRDFFAWNILKNFDKLEEPKEIMRGISETYDQWKFWSCTAMWTTHSMKSQNEKEYWRKIFIDWKDLWGKAWHSLTSYDWGDSVEKIVKTALSQGIAWEIDGKPFLFKSDARCYGKRDSWKKALIFTPLIMVFQWDTTTWNEMTKGEVKTIKKWKNGHCTLLPWFDWAWVYFYNSRASKPIATFKISISNFEKAVACGMISWRWFGLMDKKDLNQYAKEIEFAKQMIAPAKKLFEIWDPELKKKFQERWITWYLENKYWFKY